MAERADIQWVVADLENYLEPLALTLTEHSKVTVVQMREDDHLTFLTSYADPVSNQIRFEITGTWKEEHGIEENVVLVRNEGSGISYPPYHSNQRPLKKLHGKLLKAAVAEDNWPWFGLRKDAKGVFVADSGIDVSILTTLSQALNFTYSVVVGDGDWGGPQPDGTVTGMIGMVARREAHLAINEITITAARETVVDFTQPYFLESSACISKAPKEKSRAFAVLSPFSTQIWLSIGMSVIAMGLVLWTFRFLLARVSEVGVAYMSLQKLIFNMFRSLVIQSNRLPTVNWPLRIIIAAWYLYCYYIYALYSGTLTAVLAIPAYERPLDTLSEVLEATKQGIIPVVIRESSVHYIFQRATSGIYYDLGQHITGDLNYVNDPPGGITKVLKGQGKVAYINARLTSEIQMMLQGREQFYMGRQSFFPQGYGIVCPSGAGYREHFDIVLEYIVEAGLVEKWKRDEILTLNRRRNSSPSTREIVRKGPGAITITHLQGAFFIYVIGGGLALLVLMIERVVVIVGGRSGGEQQKKEG